MTIVKSLNESLAYIYCPTCRQSGNPTSMLKRDMNRVSCSFGHSWDVTSFRQLFAQQPDMTPMSEIVIEEPNPNAVRWPLYVMPEVKEALEIKLKGRLHVTIATLLSALASDEVVILSGEDASKLRARGLKNGPSIVAYIESLDQLEKDRQTAVDKLEKLMGVLNAAGISG